MFAAFACLLQLASSTPPLSVRTGERLRPVPVVTVNGASSLRADQLVAALGGIYSDAGAGDIQMQIGGRRIAVLAAAAYAIAEADTVSMTAIMVRSDGQTLLPLTFATRVLPRLIPGLRYDAQRRELRQSIPGAPLAQREASSRDGATRSSAPPQASSQPRQRVVVVDAGHGGPDNGMTGPIGIARKVREKDITLSMAQALRTALEERGVKVVMTRTTDTLIALSDRGRLANQAKGDLFLSIHVNAANPRWRDPGAARGFETYFLAEAKTEDERRVEAMENEAIKFETNADASRDDPLGFIIRDMAQNEHLRESSQLAELMQRGLRKVHPGTDRGVKQAGFRVLVTAFMPAVLVEVGFGSNRADSAFINDPDHQREMAETLAEAVIAYLQQYQRKVGGTP